jgi:hypothetical protein
MLACLILIPVIVIAGAAAWIIWDANPKSEPVASGVTIPHSQVSSTPAIMASPDQGEIIRQLQEENWKLKEQVATLKISSGATEIKAQIHGSVSGSACITKTDGSSDMLRGLHIRILPSSVPLSIMRKCAEEDELEWESLIKNYCPEDALKMLLDPAQHDAEFIQYLHKVDIIQVDYLSSCSEKAAAFRLTLPSGDAIKTTAAIEYFCGLYSAREEAIRGAINKGTLLSGQLSITGDQFASDMQSTTDRYRVKLATNLRIENGFPAAQLSSIDQPTDSDGKFIIGNIDEGGYCLHAELNLPSAFAEWAIPLKIASGGTAKIDLNNENAEIFYRTDP